MRTVQRKKDFEMRWIDAALIFLGLSLDSFVVMMNKGATIRDLSFGKTLAYALIHVVMNLAAVLVGYGISYGLKGIMSVHIQALTGCLIIFGMGVFLATRAWKYRDTEEKLDRDFDYGKCAVLAAWTCIDTLFIGACFCFNGVSLGVSLLLAGVITFLTIFLAMRIGYRWGSGYSRPVAMTGGILMIIFSIYLLSVFLLQR